jgi:hypothetical protein
MCGESSTRKVCVPDCGGLEVCLIALTCCSTGVEDLWILSELCALADSKEGVGGSHYVVS